MKMNVLLSVLLLFSTAVYSKNQPISARKDSKTDQETQLIEKYLKPLTFINTSYDEFKFASNQGNLFNKYTGHTNFTALGGNHFKAYNTFWGFNGYHRRTINNASSRIVFDLNQSHGTTDTGGLYVHALKKVYFPFFIDVFASYGQDQYKLRNTVNGDTAQGATGFARYNGNNAIVGARTFFSQNFKSFLISGDVNYIYSRFRQPEFNIVYPGFNTITPALTTKTSILIEHARLYYQANKFFAPFISGGSIQVLNRSFSRPVLGTNFVQIAPLPEIVLGKSGYNYGAGIHFQYQNIRLIPIFTHSIRGSSYKDNFIGLTAELMEMA